MKTSAMDNYEEVNLRNILLQYRRELLLIDRGVPASRLLTIYERRRLRRYGILTLDNLGYGRGRRLRLTEWARKLLKEEEA